MGMFKGREVRRVGGRLPFGTPAATAKRTAEVVGGAGAWLAVRVPTVGLHHKGALIPVAGKLSFKAHADKPELREAKKLYATALPLIPAPIAGPLRLHVDFVLEPAGNMAAFDGVLPYVGKPDRSNLVKVFEDALRRQGWMRDDSLVVEHAGGKWVSFERRYQGVWFWLSTIRDAGGPTFTGAGLLAGAVASRCYFAWTPTSAPAEHR